MKLSVYYILLFLSLVIIVFAGTAFLLIAKPFVTHQQGEISSIQATETSIGPESPLRVPVYTAVYKENGSIDYSDPRDPWKPKNRSCHRIG